MIKITCINKQAGNHYDPYSAITHLGWVDPANGNKGRNTLAEMIAFVEANPKQTFVEDHFGNKTYLFVALSARGNKYVRTTTDNTQTDNLLNLNECPLW